MLVLGRPGAGCTSFLKLLSNDRDGFDNISGDVQYGCMDHKEAEKFRQQFMFNSEGLFYHWVEEKMREASINCYFIRTR